MEDLEVRLNERSYFIKIAPDILDDSGILVRGVSKTLKIVLVSNSTVFPF